MVSLERREYTEKIRSAQEASHSETQLLLPSKTIARYLNPPPSTVYPLEYAFHLLGDVRGKTVLEFGCGDGLNTVVLAMRGARVIAFDISPELLSVARKRLEANGCEQDVELLVGSAHNLPLPDESVDVVFGMAILHHLDLELASREVRRVLRKGGRGIFEEPVRNSQLLGKVRELFPKRADISPFERPLTDKELNDFAAPFECCGRTFQLALSSIATALPFWSRRAVRLSAQVDSFLLRLCPPLEYFATIRVFQMTRNSGS
jgi:SAM-dependent methyltransferase